MCVQCVDLNNLSCHQSCPWPTSMAWNVITGYLTVWCKAITTELPLNHKIKTNLFSVMNLQHHFHRTVSLPNPVFKMCFFVYFSFCGESTSTWLLYLKSFCCFLCSETVICATFYSFCCPCEFCLSSLLSFPWHCVMVSFCPWTCNESIMC